MSNFTRRNVLAAGLCTAVIGLSGCTAGILNRRERWKYTTEGHPFVTPALDGDNVYSACNDGNIYAFTAADGTVKWRYAFDDEALSSTVPVANGLVYYADPGYNSDDGTVHAIEAATGERRWQRNLGHNLVSPTIIKDGILYVNGNDETALHALDAETGDTVNTFDSPPGNVNALSVEDETAYIAGGRTGSDGAIDGFVSAFDLETGTRKWVYRTSKYFEMNAPAISGDWVYFVSDGILHSLDADTGERNWKTDADGKRFFSWTATDDTVYGGSRDQLYALDPVDGSRKWRSDTAVNANRAVVDGSIYAPSGQKSLVALDPESGDEHWQYELEATPRSMPTLGPETVYVGTMWSIEAIRR